MLFQRSCLRYAHTTGHTNLAYTDDGEYIITCGSDGDIRKWRGIDDDDPSSNCLGEFVICVAQNGNKLLASTDRNTVQAYTFPDLDNDGTLMRFTAPVTCMRVHPSLIAAGSEDTNIKVQHTEDKIELQLEGHTGPILALDVSTEMNLLASTGGDGQLKIWNISTGTEVKSISGLARSNSFESAVCFGTPCFEPYHNNSLAYVKDKEVFVLNTTSWEVQYTLSDDRINGNYTCCQFSRDGQLLAAGCTSGEISIFDFVRKQALKCEPPASDCQSITSLAWNKNSTELAYCDSTGQLGTIFASGPVKRGDRGAASLLDNIADEVDYNDIAFDGNDADGLNDDAVLNDNADTGDRDGDGYDDDDNDGVSIEKLKRKIMQSVNGGLNVDENSKDSVGSISVLPATLAPKAYKMQAAFQPSSTPSHLEHRYLVWNEVGIVTAHADSAEGSIDVEFHDASVHHSLHITNYNNHNMASLSSNVLALSGEGAGKFVCIALAAAGNKEWSMQLPDCETAEAIVATSKLVGVVTSMNFLRLFSVLGTQREVLSIPGPVVATAGHEERLLVCYHNSPSSEQQQHLAALLIQTSGLQLRVQQLSLPLTANRQVTWLGFSDCGSPVFCDSMGLLQLYSQKSGCWYPICDTLKQSQSVSNNYFTIAVSECSQIVQAVLCRGSSYPMTNPRPMMQELAMQLPLCDAEAQKTELEDALVRSAIMNADGANKLLKETAIKLFALACRSELEARAKELIEMIACPELLQLAVKYATKLGRIHLSDRLSEMMPHLLEQRNEQRELEMQHTLLSSPALHYSGGTTLTPTSQTAARTSKLAPKVMELNHAKRVSLKRFSVSNHTPKNFVKSETATPPATHSTPDCETQENIFEPNSDLEKDTQLLPLSKETNASGETSTVIRAPLNTVNPFAAKRKLNEGDFLLGTATLQKKFKMPQK